MEWIKYGSYHLWSLGLSLGLDHLASALGACLNPLSGGSLSGDILTIKINTCIKEIMAKAFQ